MTIEEELVSLREENTALREQLAQRDELIQQQQALLCEQTEQGLPWADDLKSLLLDMKEATDQARALGKWHLEPQEVVAG